MRAARAQGADVAHFPEACLSGYVGPDIASCDEIDWDALRACTGDVQAVACELGIWVVVGSTHQLTAPHPPHNCVYVINDRGELVDRYDKRFTDLPTYSPGDHLCVFLINDITCGVLICHDFRYPELQRAYRALGVQLMFHSFHAGGANAAWRDENVEYIGEAAQLNFGTSIPEITMVASMQAVAASSHMWISCPNSSRPISAWGSFFVRADGIITGRLPVHRDGVLISRVDPDGDLYDSTATWRHRALGGVLYSGDLVDDPRSEARQSL